ncbi:MAG: class I SAM-dependent methyltransferase [Candidatus Thorarchaeota archaeon]|nr:class I SAM-dependent methyltransferase [Candidatus Thorarchaeota archaeon]
MTHHLGKANWNDEERINGLIRSYSTRYDNLFWKTFIPLVGPEPRKAIADFGCGPGLFLVDAAEKFSAQVLIGLDESQEMLDHAEQFIQERTSVESYELKTINFDVTRIPLQPDSVDLAFSGYMLHEVSDPQDFVKQIGRIVRRGGVYVVYDFVSGNEAVFVQKMIERDMSEEQARKRYPHMCKHSIDDIISLMRDAGLKEVKGRAVNDIRAVVVGHMK